MELNNPRCEKSIDDQQLVDDNWFKLAKQVFATCCSTLRQKVLQHVSTRDLMNFSVQINPIGRDDWSTNMAANDEMLAFIDTSALYGSDGNSEEGKKAAENAIKSLLKKTCTYSALLEIQYDMYVPNA